MQISPTHQTTAQRALAISEIQTLALDVTDFQGSHPRRNMLHVALTCRMFLEMGLDLLWESLPDLECLLAIWEAYGVFSIDRRYQLSRWIREPTDLEWDRLTYYSRRIRLLAIQTAIEFPPPLLASLTQVIRARTSDLSVPIFLRLRTVHWEEHLFHNAQGELCRVMIREAPRLESIKGSADILIWPVLLGEIRSHSKQIHDLSIQQKRFSLIPQSGFASFAGPLAELIHGKDFRALDIPSSLVADPDVQQSIFLSPNLHTLHIQREILQFAFEDGAEGEDAEEELAELTILLNYPTINDGAMLKLKSLRGGFADVGGLVGPIIYLHLRDLEVEQPYGGKGQFVTWDLFRRFLGAVGSCCPNLETYSSTAQVVHSPDDVAPRAGILMRLTECTRMTRFRLTLWCDPIRPVSTPIDFNPTDEEWLILSKSWPNLQDLIYGCHPDVSWTTVCAPFQPQPRASIKALEHIIKHHSKLDWLNIPFYIRKEDFDGDESSTTERRKPSVRSLFVLQSSIDEDVAAQRVSSYLKSFLSHRQGGLVVPTCGDLITERHQMPMPPATPEEERRCEVWANIKRLVEGSGGSSTGTSRG